MNVNVKKDKNKFIEIILNKISMAQNFSQKVALTITKKKILKHVTLKFYLRRRFKRLYLYIRVDDRFRNRLERGRFYRDMKLLVSSLDIEGTHGNYTGLILELCNDTNESLILLLKLISLFSRPKDFYVKNGTIWKSYYNYVDSSKIPIHVRFTNNLLSNLENEDLIELFNSIKEYNNERCNRNNQDNFDIFDINSN